MARQNPQPQSQQMVQEEMDQQATANKPVHVCRHRNLKASIWRNDTGRGTIYNVTITRSYRQDDGWHDSVSFSYDDLMNVAKLMFDAHTFISDIRRKEISQPQPEEAFAPERQQVVATRRGQERSGK